MKIERGNYSVLVVDDNPAAKYALARGLRASGFNTVEASAGAEALELSEYVSAVVLDVHLPDVDGYEVCRLIRSRDRTAKLPIVHVSALYTSEQDIAEGSRAGADDYFVAPVNPALLAQRLDHLLVRLGATR